MLYLLCFGNPYLSEDNLALLVADLIIKEKIKGLEVIKCVSPDELLHYTDKNFIILDVVKGLTKTELINDIDTLKANNIVTLHDFDLGFFLKLMKETNKIDKDKIRIIGIPQHLKNGSAKTLKDEVLRLIPIKTKHS